MISARSSASVSRVGTRRRFGWTSELETRRTNYTISKSEIAKGALEKGINPDRLSHEAIAAELTNHLIEGVVLTPGMAGTIPKLQQSGFHYAKSIRLSIPRR
jgi:hypothetical protein